MSPEIYTDIEIGASAEHVWQLLTDFEGYPRWNPFIRRARGQARAGQRVKIYTRPQGELGMGFRPRILVAEPGRELSWRGRLFIPGLFQGTHSFLIQPLGEGRVRFIHREVFTGLLVPLFARRAERYTRRGFAAMNQALKALAEHEGV